MANRVAGGLNLPPTRDRGIGSRRDHYIKPLMNKHENTLIQVLYRTFQGQKEQYSPMPLNLRGQKEEPD
jgi:hypothetical protein